VCRLHQYLTAWDDIVDLQKQTNVNSQKMETSSLGICSQHLQIQTHTNSDIAPLTSRQWKFVKKKKNSCYTVLRFTTVPDKPPQTAVKGVALYRALIVYSCRKPESYDPNIFIKCIEGFISTAFLLLCMYMFNCVLL